MDDRVTGIRRRLGVVIVATFAFAVSLAGWRLTHPPDGMGSARAAIRAVLEAVAASDHDALARLHGHETRGPRAATLLLAEIGGCPVEHVTFTAEVQVTPGSPRHFDVTCTQPGRAPRAGTFAVAQDHYPGGRWFFHKLLPEDLS